MAFTLNELQDKANAVYDLALELARAHVRIDPDTSNRALFTALDAVRVLDKIRTGT